MQRSIERVLDYLNHELQGQEFLAAQFSVADIGFVPRLLVLHELGVDAALNRGNVDAWIKRMLERSSIQNLQGVTAQFVTGV
jgi:glutathione S-transferase